MPHVEYTKRQLSLRHKALMGGVAVVAIVVAGIVGWHYYIQAQDKSFAQLGTDVRLLTATNQKAAAIAKAEAYARKSPVPKYKQAAYAMAGGLAEALPDLPAAMRDYRAAEAANKTESIGTVEGIARVAREQGDSATSIAYYRKCITVLDKHTTFYSSEIDRYKGDIKSQGGTP